MAVERSLEGRAQDGSMDEPDAMLCIRMNEAFHEAGSTVWRSLENARSLVGGCGTVQRYTSLTMLVARVPRCRLEARRRCTGFKLNSSSSARQYHGWKRDANIDMPSTWLSGIHARCLSHMIQGLRFKPQKRGAQIVGREQSCPTTP